MYGALKVARLFIEELFFFTTGLSSTLEPPMLLCKPTDITLETSFRAAIRRDHRYESMNAELHDKKQLHEWSEATKARLKSLRKLTDERMKPDLYADLNP